MKIVIKFLKIKRITENNNNKTAVVLKWARSPLKKRRLENTITTSNMYYENTVEAWSLLDLTICFYGWQKLQSEKREPHSCRSSPARRRSGGTAARIAARCAGASAAARGTSPAQTPTAWTAPWGRAAWTLRHCLPAEEREMLLYY